MRLFSPKREDAVALVLDIGSGSVAGAIVRLATAVPSLLYAVRRDILHSEQGDARRLLSKMLAALAQVLTILRHEGFPTVGLQPFISVREALVFFSAPWAISRTDFLHLSEKKSLVITEDLFRELLRSHKEGEVAMQSLIPIEQKLIKAELNGYDTPSPYRKQASRAVFAVFSSFSDAEVIKKTETAINGAVHPQRISFHSFALGAAAALQALYPNEEDFMVLDVSGEQTEVAVVKKGVLLQNITFPFGRSHFIRHLALRVKFAPGAAATFLKLYGEGKGTGPAFASAARSAEKAAADWRHHFEHAVALFSNELFLPQTVFITADVDMQALIERNIKAVDAASLAPGASPFRPVQVTEEILSSSFSAGAGVGSTDTFLTLETLFSNKLRFGN